MQRVFDTKTMALTTRLAAAALSVLGASFPVDAQQAGRPITIVVPYAAGGNTPDIVARILGQELQLRLGQPVVIDNKPGASGNIGTHAVARAAPDGHTLLMAAPAFAQNVGLFKSMPYDPVKDFAPIILVSEVSIALVVHPSVPATSARAFIEYVKAQPGRLNYSSPGHGTPHHLSMELFRLATHIDIKHVPYRALGNAVQDLVGGHVSAMFLPLPVSLPLANDGKIRLLAVASERRVAVAPDLPTLTEEGISGVEIGIWIGLLAPAATPRAIVDRYNTIVNEILRSPQIAEKMASQGINVAGGTAAHFSTRIQNDVVTWLKVVKDAGITAE